MGSSWEEVGLQGTGRVSSHWAGSSKQQAELVQLSWEGKRGVGQPQELRGQGRA